METSSQINDCVFIDSLDEFYTCGPPGSCIIHLCKISPMSKDIHKCIYLKFWLYQERIGAIVCDMESYYPEAGAKAAPTLFPLYIYIPLA